MTSTPCGYFVRVSPCFQGESHFHSTANRSHKDGEGHRKVLKSRNGVKVTLDDTDGSESLLLETPAGQKISLKDGNQSLTIEDASGNSVKLASSGITINAAARVTINASMVEINAGMTKASGVVKCDTLIANSVISASYTPGAGNVW